MKYPISALLVITFLCLHFFTTVSGQAGSGAFIAGDFADPSIIRAQTKFYAAGTSSEWAPHFSIYVSENLQDWKQAGYVFDKAPAWTSGSFWAPEYYFHNNTYYIYYTARRKADNISCIGVATSKFPDRDFQDRGVVVSFGKEAIDAFVYNDNGRLYITFKAYGLDDRPIEILGSKLSEDGLKTEGEVFSLLKDDNRKGMEGQSILKQHDFYYLFYSAGGCCGKGCSYNVRVARSKNFKGPYEDYSRNPILQANDVWECAGHGTFVEEGNKKYVYMHHAYNKASNVFTGRQGILSELSWQNDWPALVIRQKTPAITHDITTTFQGNKVAAYWQWDFRNTVPVATQKNGTLSLSGTFKETNTSGIVLTVRPVSSHFDMTTTVVNNNAALKGLAFYGDSNAAIGIGVLNDTVAYWLVKENVREVIATQKIKAGTPVQLKLTMHPDITCEVFFKQQGADWQQMAPGKKQAVDFLPQWDRSPRPGLHFKGAPGLSATFSDFALINK